MTRERLDILIGLVLQCRALKGYNVSVDIDRYGEEIAIWRAVPEDGIRYTIYRSGAFSRASRDGEIVNIADPELVKAEEHLNRILMEVERENVGE